MSVDALEFMPYVLLLQDRLIWATGRFVGPSEALDFAVALRKWRSE